MKASKALITVLKMIFLTVCLILFVFPFVILLINSFKPTKDVVSNPLSLPDSISFANFTDAIDKMNFFTSLSNTVIITAGSVILIALFSAMTAHYFVRNPSKGNQLIFFLMVASMIIPFQAIMIPLVDIYGSLGLLNSKASLIYMYIGFGASLAVFVYHGFIKSIPVELEEASMIDGCTRLQTFFRIVIPVMLPTTMTICVLNVLWIWNDFLLPSLILVSPKTRTLPLSTYFFYGSYTVDYGPMMAGLIMTILPIIIIYLFAQKYIIQGVMQGAVK